MESSDRQKGGTARLHAFDALRGVMMLLGLVLHSAMSYVTFPTGEDWPFKDPGAHVSFDLLVVWIHVFRMPVFFVVAGFFGALLYSRRGRRGFVDNRLKRIALPLAIAWPLLLPLVIGASIYGQQQLGTLPVFDQAIPLADIFDHLMHLWFLYHLLIFYAAAIAAMFLVARIPRGVIAWLNDALRRGIPHSAAPFLLAALSYPALAAMETGGMEGSDSFVPPLRILSTYGFFFGFGWLLFGQRGRLSWFGSHAWRHVAFGTLGFAIYIVAIDEALTRSGGLLAYRVGIAALAATTWCWVYAFLGLFLRYFGGANPTMRYAADASYWMYLVHLPFTMWIPALLFQTTIPAGAKFAGVLGITTVIALASYRVLVRSTAIGALLNGRRYPATARSH